MTEGVSFVMGNTKRMAVPDEEPTPPALVQRESLHFAERFENQAKPPDEDLTGMER